MIKNTVSISKTSSIAKVASSGGSAKCGNLMSWLKQKEIPLENGTATNISFVQKNDALGLLFACCLDRNKINNFIFLELLAVTYFCMLQAIVFLF